MKKMIAIVSACMTVGFAVALANADDTTTTTTKSTDTETMTKEQQAGTAGSASGSSASDSASTASSSDRWASAKTCTDSSGAVYKRGKKGFDTCVQSMRKSETKDQMSGQSGENLESTPGAASTPTQQPGSMGTAPSDTGASSDTGSSMGGTSTGSSSTSSGQ